MRIDYTSLLYVIMVYFSMISFQISYAKLHNFQFQMLCPPFSI